MLTEIWASITAPGGLVVSAGVLFTIGYLIIIQVVLRCFILVGTLLYIWYYWTVADAPLWEAVVTSVFTGIANLIGLFQLYVRRSAWAIPKAYREVYDTHFSTLSPGDFRAVVKQADRKKCGEDMTVTVENLPNDAIYFLLSGEAYISKRGHRFVMPAGIFIGEVSYLLENKASATTVLSNGSDVLVWKRDQIEKIAARRPRFKLAFDAIISRDMARKVAYAVAPSDTTEAAE